MSSHSEFIPRPKSRRYSQRDINILIMGETGVGKSTIINAFANYLVHNTLRDAIRGEMQVVIPSKFHITDPGPFEPKEVFVGNSDDDDNCHEAGQSCTQVCRSYLYPIGKRILRLIDAPGIGDVRGLDQDKLNCDHILAYLHHYEYLNGICIVFKPDHERLTINFRFCFKEILTHLHINAKDNLMFIFTNGRKTFYKPGGTTPLLRRLLNELNETWKVEIPFNTGNTFMFDNEAFRFLALYKNGIRFPQEETESYSKSWQKSAEEFSRLIHRILQCEKHAVQDSLSINAARQLVRKLTRPLGEIARSIQENIQLVEKHKQKVLQNPPSTLRKQIPQKIGKFVAFDYPRTVCTNRKCTRIVDVDGQKSIDYAMKCHPQCYLRDVERECVGHPILQYCDAIDRRTGFCKVCRCSCQEHMHTIYEYRTSIIYVEVDNAVSASPTSAIDERINILRYEEKEILRICHELSQFMQENSLTPYNDEITEYIRYFIREEETKRGAGAQNQEVIQGLQRMIGEYEKEQRIHQRASTASKRSRGSTCEPEAIFGLAGQLYKLPIHGRSIREQVEGLKQLQFQGVETKESFVRIPIRAKSSTIMTQLIQIVSEK